MTEKFLEMKNISKKFGGVEALNRVDFEINKGEIHCLVGENGSGKSTLIKIISGVLKPEPDSYIKIDGEEVNGLSSFYSLKKGVQVIYQDLSLFPNLTVAENIGINRYIKKGSLVNWRETKKIAQTVLEKIGVEIDLEREVGSLSIADRQLVAICRAFAANAKLIIMDEPTASLTRNEVDKLFAVIRDMQEKGITTIFVSHKIDEIMEIAERVTLLRDGVKIGTYASSQLDLETITFLMTGHKIKYSRELPKVASHLGLLKINNLSQDGFYKNISFKLDQGEILGITGLLGSGRTELALSLFGINPADSGEIIIDDKKVRLRNKDDAQRLGISYVPEDRLNQGLIMEQSVSNNLILTILDQLHSRFKLINRVKKSRIVNKWVDNLRIKVTSTESKVKTLSGGNQQKIVLAKWIATNPRILILDGPTVGIDVAAKDSIYQIIKELAKRGIGIILISDEIEEVYFNCHRIIVMRKGRIIAEYDTDKITPKELNDKINVK